MTMNPNSDLSRMRSETHTARAATIDADKPAKRLVGPAALFSAGFILTVSLIAKVFYK